MNKLIFFQNSESLVGNSFLRFKRLSFFEIPLIYESLNEFDLLELLDFSNWSALITTSLFGKASFPAERASLGHE